jgi:ribosomal protein L18
LPFNPFTAFKSGNFAVSQIIEASVLRIAMLASAHDAVLKQRQCGKS